MLSGQRHRKPRNESGAVAIIVALSMVGLLVIAGMTLDFGLARMDRQINKSAADDAVTAGIHGFDTGDGQVHSFRGVCMAINFLKSNEPALSALSWAACSNSTQLAKVCKSSDSTTWAAFSQTVGRYRVEIDNPYTMPDSRFSEDTLPVSSTDDGTPCKQLAVIITESRRPGFGSLATSADIATTVRSVGRVDIGPGKQAPALLLLDQTHCQVLQVAASGAGADSHIRVKGASTTVLNADGSTSVVQTPGSIHSDSDGKTNCSSPTGPPLFLGKAADGIVAYGAPDGSQPGIISSYSLLNGSPYAVSDGTTNVYGTTAKDWTTTGTKTDVVPRDRIYRSVVDARYLQGVRSALSTADSMFALNPNTLTSPWTVVKGPDCSSPTASEKSAAQVYVNCTKTDVATGSTTYQATTIVFGSEVDPTNLQLPNAKYVYVLGSGNKGISNIASFSMHTSGNVDGSGNCTTNATSPVTGDQAVLVVRNGSIDASNSPAVLRMCRTTVLLEGGYALGCTPSAAGQNIAQNPYTKPCSSFSQSGNGYLNFAGGTLDWTAPNTYDQIPVAQQTAAWNNLEDLALWGESYGTSSNWSMSGGSTLHLVGVFMTPNASPFVISGSSTQSLTNAQYISSSFTVKGGANLIMTVDPNNTITLPTLTPFTMVR